MSILRTIGIDISKDWLDIFAKPEGRASRFSNDPIGFRKLIAWIGSGVHRGAERIGRRGSPLVHLRERWSGFGGRALRRPVRHQRCTPDGVACRIRCMRAPFGKGFHFTPRRGGFAARDLPTRWRSLPGQGVAVPVIGCGRRS